MRNVASEVDRGRNDVAGPLMRTKRKRGKMRLRDHNRTSVEDEAGGGGLERG